MPSFVSNYSKDFVLEGVKNKKYCYSLCCEIQWVIDCMELSQCLRKWVGCSSPITALYRVLIKHSLPPTFDVDVKKL